ncbi:molybdopterin oxidoreductase family protein [Anaerolineales bacterium HSG25]|nr:molybdopterin oxidoreductase family protein [Anaerolineales bacterium HSG25]
MLEKIHGACPHDCPDTCGVITEVKNGQAIKFYGDPEHTITQGWLCAKVRPYLEHVYHPDRLQTPLRRIGSKGAGKFAEISWAEAISEIGQQWRTIIAKHGAESILPYSYSGTLGLVQMGVCNTRFWNRLGTSQLERAICGAAAEYAVQLTIGARHAPRYQDVADSRLVIIWGNNPVSTAPHFMPHLKKAQRNGCRVIVIDPRCTRTARGADWHIAPIPGTDGALAMGMAHVIVAQNQHDEAWLQQNSFGWNQLRARLADYPPEQVATITGLSEQTIIDLANQYAATRPSMIKIADGLQRNRHGGQTIRAICALPALTGQYGQPSGGLMYSTSDYVKWDREAMRHTADCPPLGRSVNMNRLGAALTGEVSDPPIQSLYVFGANPMAASPNAGLIAKGLQRDDLFTVVHDLFLTDTADYADIVLPATSQLEQTDLNKGYGHTWLTYNQQAIEPLGQAKSNWQVLQLLATEMGFDEPWLHQSVDEVLTEILEATSANSSIFVGITLERLKKEHTVHLNLPHEIPFVDLQFPTPSGKVELYSARLAQQGLDPLPGWQDLSEDYAPPTPEPTMPPLSLLTGAAHHFTSTSFANQASLLKRENTPFLEIHPDDAAARQIMDGQTVVVENGRGYCKLKAVVTEAVRPGVVVSPKGRWSKFDPFANGDGGRNVNWTTSDELADMAGQSTFHSNRVWVRVDNE